MDRRTFSLSMVGAAVLAGCGGDAGGLPPALPAPAPTTPLLPEFATPTSLPAGTMFPQTIAATDGDRSVAPGQANIWDLNGDFSIEDGGNDQFDGVLHLFVNVGGARTAFPSDQTHAELTALGPEMASADGIKTVSFTSETAFLTTTGRYAYLHPGTEIRLQQTLNLTTAIGPAISLVWSGTYSPGFFSTPLSDPAQYVQVVLRDTAGGLLSTLFRQDHLGTSGTWGSAPLTAFTGQTVVLSFEQRVWANNPNWGGLPAGSSIDNVSVKDGANTEFVANGDFEAEGNGWTMTASKASQNVRSGTRTVHGLEVQRTFYTQPNQLWARLTDVFHNPTAAPIVAEVSYESNLGSDNRAIISPPPGVALKALTAWDYKSNGGISGDRDIGFAFGTADLVGYTSDTALGAGNGGDDLLFKFNITVPAGGSVTLINFVVMSGTDTGLTATNIMARATEVDTQLTDTVNNFRTKLIYQRGLTQAQLDSLKNF